MMVVIFAGGIALGVCLIIHSLHYSHVSLHSIWP